MMVMVTMMMTKLMMVTIMLVSLTLRMFGKLPMFMTTPMMFAPAADDGHAAHAQ